MENMLKILDFLALRLNVSFNMLKLIQNSELLCSSLLDHIKFEGIGIFVYHGIICCEIIPFQRRKSVMT